MCGYTNATEQETNSLQKHRQLVINGEGVNFQVKPVAHEYIPTHLKECLRYFKKKQTYQILCIFRSFILLGNHYI